MAGENNERPWLLGKLWDEVSSFFLAMFNSVWSGFTEQMDFIGPRIANSILNWIGKPEEKAWNNMLNIFISNGLMTSAEAKEIRKNESFFERIE